LLPARAAVALARRAFAACFNTDSAALTIEFGLATGVVSIEVPTTFK
jgi:hypothetical protein